jgi:hypothetical protein
MHQMRPGSPVVQSCFRPPPVLVSVWLLGRSSIDCVCGATSAVSSSVKKHHAKRERYEYSTNTKKHVENNAHC